MLEERRRSGVSVVVSKVKGHAKWKHVRSGAVRSQDKYGNDAADTLACAGADTHVVPARVRRQARARTTLGVMVQAMMVDILEARNAVAFGPSALLCDAGSDEAVVISSGSEDDSDLEVLAECIVVSDDESNALSAADGNVPCAHPFGGHDWVDQRFGHVGLHPWSSSADS